MYEFKFLNKIQWEKYKNTKKYKKYKKYKNTKIQKYKNTKIQKYKNAKTNIVIRNLQLIFTLYNLIVNF